VVQGVGFRPFVYRLAPRLELAGWVGNSSPGVPGEVEGPAQRVDEFRRRLVLDRPARSAVQELRCAAVPASSARGATGARFEIRTSAVAGEKQALVLPDLATCPDCVRELGDRADRRFRYPFTNCTRCGPRYSILLDLPYDRSRTTMARFALCPACRAEYEDPGDRRFHAEPTACPDCGPQLALWDPSGRPLAFRDDALRQAADALRRGRIVAVKGLGGFHLCVDARDDGAVAELRRRKRREAKPLAVMVACLGEARSLALLDALEEELLGSPEAPIVLVRRRSDAALSQCVAPGNPCVGLLLPYTPLHHLLMAEIGFPVVATSGNGSGEPICTDEREALQRLQGIADVFLVHDREIARPLDDSVARIVAGRPALLRRARGYAPLPVAALPSPLSGLAVGGHLKNTVAVAAGGRVFVSPHVGDLDTAAGREHFRCTARMLSRLYGVTPQVLACDPHPDYASTLYARASGQPVVEVQHHYAHVLSAMADNELDPPALGFAWDGSGYGADGTVWGGEALHVDASSFRRVAWLRPFRLPGGERAVLEPRRSALGLLHAQRGDSLLEDDADPVWALFSREERRVLCSMLAAGLNAPLTTSAGRLFDAVAALIGLHPVAGFEGQAAMALEFAIDASVPAATYRCMLAPRTDGLEIDWRPLLEGVRADLARRRAPGAIARGFHDAMVEAIVEVARHVGLPRVVLSGGCFQNKYLTERAVVRLRAEGFEPSWHRRLPPNDGGLALGQLVGAARALGRS
jgi:hydrogenase maturation protein HypF